MEDVLIESVMWDLQTVREIAAKVSVLREGTKGGLWPKDTDAYHTKAQQLVETEMRAEFKLAEVTTPIPLNSLAAVGPSEMSSQPAPLPMHLPIHATVHPQMPLHSSQPQQLATAQQLPVQQVTA